MKKLLASALLFSAVLGSVSFPTQAKDGRNGALIGGIAVGALGGVLIDRALNGGDDFQADAPPPPPPPPVAKPLPPRRAVFDDYSYDPQPPPPSRDGQTLDSFYQLRRGCMNWDRKACILMGIFLGEHRQQQAAWRRQHPDYFNWDDYAGQP